ILLLLFLTTPHTPTSTLFPYTTLFRSIHAYKDVVIRVLDLRQIVFEHLADHAVFVPQRNKDGDAPLGSLTHLPLSRQRKGVAARSEEHTSELHHQIISYAVFCLKKKKN